MARPRISTPHEYTSEDELVPHGNADFDSFDTPEGVTPWDRHIRQKAFTVKRAIASSEDGSSGGIDTDLLGDYIATKFDRFKDQHNSEGWAKCSPEYPPFTNDDWLKTEGYELGVALGGVLFDQSGNVPLEDLDFRELGMQIVSGLSKPLPAAVMGFWVTPYSSFVDGFIAGAEEALDYLDSEATAIDRSDLYKDALEPLYR